MDSSRIVEKIMQDARKKVDEIKKDTKIQTDLILKDAREKIEKEKRESSRSVQQELKSLKENYEVSLSLEKKKRLLSVKQEVLQELKARVVDEFQKLDKKTKLKYIETLLKDNAKEKDTVEICLKDITKKDVLGLKVSAKLNLQVVMGEDVGIKIMSTYYDTDLLLDSIVEGLIKKNEKQLMELLFN